MGLHYRSVDTPDIFSAAPIGRCPYGMDGVSHPSVRMYVCMYVRTRATAKSSSSIFTKFRM